MRSFFFLLITISLQAFSQTKVAIPVLEKDKLDAYYKARKTLSGLYNSKKFSIEFKLMPGDLLMMDNHRLLHGRTSYDANEGKRYLQGCYGSKYN